MTFESLNTSIILQAPPSNFMGKSNIGRLGLEWVDLGRFDKIWVDLLEKLYWI